MKNYVISNNRGVNIVINTDAPNNGREGVITSLQNLDTFEIQEHGFVFDVGDLIDEGVIVNYAKANNFNLESF